MRKQVEVVKQRQKVYYDYHIYGPRYGEGQQVVCFFSFLKEGRHEEIQIVRKSSLDTRFWIERRVCHREMRKI